MLLADYEKAKLESEPQPSDEKQEPELRSAIAVRPKPSNKDAKAGSQSRGNRINRGRQDGADGMQEGQGLGAGGTPRLRLVVEKEEPRG